MDIPIKTEQKIYYHKHFEDIVSSPSSEIHEYIKMLNEKDLDISDAVVLGIEEFSANQGSGCY